MQCTARQKKKLRAFADCFIKMAGDGVTEIVIWRMIAGITMKEKPCIASIRVRIVVLDMPDVSITEFLNGVILWRTRKVTCKDCIHYDVCNMYDGPYISVHFDHTCKYFTDKQLVAFLPCKVGEEVYVMNGGNIPQKNDFR